MIRQEQPGQYSRQLSQRIQRLSIPSITTTFSHQEPAFIALPGINVLDNVQMLRGVLQQSNLKATRLSRTRILTQSRTVNLAFTHNLNGNLLTIGTSDALDNYTKRSIAKQHCQTVVIEMTI